MHRTNVYAYSEICFIRNLYTITFLAFVTYILEN